MIETIRSQPIAACLGGWCRHRDRCLHHIAPTTRSDPAERLCAIGRDVPVFQPIAPIRPAPVAIARPAEELL